MAGMAGMAGLLEKRYKLYARLATPKPEEIGKEWKRASNEPQPPPNGDAACLDLGFA